MSGSPEMPSAEPWSEESAAASHVLTLPRLLGLFDDAHEGTAADGRPPKVWALVRPDGWAITATATSPHGVAIWPSLADAEAGLDAYVGPTIGVTG